VPATSPRQAPLSASTAAIACTRTPRPIPLPTSPKPRRRSGVVRKLISLVSWMASTCRSATAEDVCALQPAIKRSTVTFSLARNRPKPTSRARSPPLSRRRQMLWRATMSPSSAAPFYRAGGLGTHPTTDCHSTLRHPESVRSVTERITDQPLPASHNRTPSQSAAPPRSVHAVEPRWGRIGGALPISARHGSLPPMRIVVLGGGVVGVTTAYQLQRDGLEVVERNPEVAAGASWGNAGMIAPGHSFVWTSPRAPVILATSLMLKDQAL